MNTIGGNTDAVRRYLKKRINFADRRHKARVLTAQAKKANADRIAAYVDLSSELAARHAQIREDMAAGRISVPVSQYQHDDGE